MGTDTEEADNIMSQKAHSTEDISDTSDNRQVANDNTGSMSHPSSPFDGYKHDSILRLVPPTNKPSEEEPDELPSSSDPPFIEGYKVDSILRITPRKNRSSHEPGINSSNIITEDDGEELQLQPYQAEDNESEDSDGDNSSGDSESLDDDDVDDSEAEGPDGPTGTETETVSKVTKTFRKNIVNNDSDDEEDADDDDDDEGTADGDYSDAVCGGSIQDGNDNEQEVGNENNDEEEIASVLKKTDAAAVLSVNSTTTDDAGVIRNESEGESEGKGEDESEGASVKNVLLADTDMLETADDADVDEGIESDVEYEDESEGDDDVLLDAEKVEYEDESEGDGDVLLDAEKVENVQVDEYSDVIESHANSPAMAKEMIDTDEEDSDNAGLGIEDANFDDDDDGLENDDFDEMAKGEHKSIVKGNTNSPSLTEENRSEADGNDESMEDVAMAGNVEDEEDLDDVDAAVSEDEGDLKAISSRKSPHSRGLIVDDTEADNFEELDKEKEASVLIYRKGSHGLESDADEDGLEALERDLNQKRKSVDGGAQLTGSDHDNRNADDERNVDGEHHSDDSESDEEERLLRMYRNPDKSGTKRNRNDDGSGRKYNDTIGDMSDEFLDGGEIDDDDDGFERLGTVDDEAIEVPNYRSEDERDEEHEEFGMIGEELDNDDDGGDDSEGTVGAGESAEEDTEEEDEEPDEEMLAFIVDDDDDELDEDEEIESNPLDEAEKLLEGREDEDSEIEMNPDIVSSSNYRKIREGLVDEQSKRLQVADSDEQNDNDNTPKKRASRRIVDDDDDDDDDEIAEQNENGNGNMSRSCTGQASDLVIAPKDAKVCEDDDAWTNEDEDINGIADQANDNSFEKDKTSEEEADIELAPVNDHHVHKILEGSDDLGDSEAIDMETGTDNDDDSKDGDDNDDSKKEDDKNNSDVSDEMDSESDDEPSISPKLKRRLLKPQSNEDYNFSSMLRVRPLPQSWLAARSSSKSKNQRPPLPTRPKRPRTSTSLEESDSAAGLSEHDEDEDVSDVNADEFDESEFDEDVVDGDNDIRMGTDQQVSLNGSDKDATVHFENDNEEGKGNDERADLSMRENDENMDERNVPGGRRKRALRKYVKRMVEKKLGREGMLERIMPKLKRRRRWTAEEASQVDRLKELVLQTCPEYSIHSTIRVPSSDGVAFYGSAWISVLYGKVRVCGATLTPSSPPILFQSPVDQPLLVYDCVKEDEGDRVDNLNDPELMTLKRLDDGKGVDGAETMKNGHTDVLVNGNDHQRRSRIISSTKVKNKGSSSNGWANGNHMMTTDNVEDEDHEDESNESDMLSIIPHIQGVPHIDAVKHVVTRTKNHEDLCKIVHAHVKTHRKKQAHPDPIVFITEVLSQASAPPLCPDLPHSIVNLHHSIPVANDSNGYVEPVNFLRLYNGEYGLNIKVPRVIKHIGGCADRLLVLGAPNSGKSSMSRTIVNYHLTNQWNSDSIRNIKSSRVSKGVVIAEQNARTKQRTNSEGEREERFFIQRRIHGAEDQDGENEFDSHMNGSGNHGFEKKDCLTAIAETQDDLDDLYQSQAAEEVACHSPLIYVDVDVGVPDRGMPGVIAAHVVTLPSVSRRSACRSIPFCARFFGEVTPRENPEYYNECVRDVVLAARARAVQTKLPILVNCHGWMTDSGATLVSFLSHLVDPTLIVRMRGGTSVSTARSSDIAIDRLLFPPSSAVTEEEEEAEAEDRESEEERDDGDGNEKGHENRVQYQNQTFNKKPFHKRGPIHRYHALGQCWSHEMQRNALNNIDDGDPLKQAAVDQVALQEAQLNELVGTSRPVPYCACGKVKSKWPMFVTNGRPATQEFDRTSLQGKDEREHVMCAYFAQELCRGSVRQVRVRDVKIVFVGSDRSFQGNDNGDGSSTVLGNNDDGVDDDLSDVDKIGGNDDNSNGDGNDLMLINDRAGGSSKRQWKERVLQQQMEMSKVHRRQQTLEHRLKPTVFDALHDAGACDDGGGVGASISGVESKGGKFGCFQFKTIDGVGSVPMSDSHIPPQALISCTVALAHQVEVDDNESERCDNDYYNFGTNIVKTKKKKNRLNVLGMGLVRGVNDAGTVLFVACPLPLDVLQRCNVVMVGLGVHTAGALITEGSMKYATSYQLSFLSQPDHVPFLLAGHVDSGGRQRVRKSTRGEDGRRYR